MTSPTHSRVAVIADFNADLFGRYLSNAVPAATSVEVQAFGQVYQSLASRPSDATASAVIWTRPEGAIASFARALDFDEVSHDTVLSEVDAFADAIAAYAGEVRHVFVPTWVMPPGSRGYGLLDYRQGLGVAHLVARMNLRLVERLSTAANVYVLDAERWMRAVTRAQSPKMWYATKVPYANQVFEHAALDVAAALDGLAGLSRRLIVLDLDNTLWGGVIGEGGWQSITLGGHDHVGEAYADFQRALRAINRRGVQLAVVSKNDESVALEAFDNHPEMAIRRAHLAAWRINWDDKARNLAALVEDLNLRLGSVVFIDDSAIERARIRETFPEILVPEWPEDPALFRSALESLRCFDVAVLSAEDRQRGAMYAAERERRATRDRVGSLDEWLKTLGITIEVAELSDANVKRAAQLFNKTNQMNLATRRLSEGELRAWAADPSRRLWTLSVADRFGPSGLTGIVSVELNGERACLTDFLLSCRVMGRRVEETMLFLAESFARERGAKALLAEYITTARNRPCLEFFERSRMARRGDNLFVRPLDDEPVLPECVTLIEMKEPAG